MLSVTLYHLRDEALANERLPLLVTFLSVR